MQTRAELPAPVIPDRANEIERFNAALLTSEGQLVERKANQASFNDARRKAYTRCRTLCLGFTRPARCHIAGAKKSTIELQGRLSVRWAVANSIAVISRVGRALLDDDGKFVPRGSPHASLT
jgi:hypothetical protein